MRFQKCCEITPEIFTPASYKTVLENITKYKRVYEIWVKCRDLFIIVLIY